MCRMETEAGYNRGKTSARHPTAVIPQVNLNLQEYLGCRLLAQGYIGVFHGYAWPDVIKA